MKIFKINEQIEIVCDWKKTRMAFKHEATLFVYNTARGFAKICYQNRTWEKYEFESVARLVVDKADLSDADKKLCNEWLDGDRTDWSGFKATAMVAKMGEILTDNKKEANDWKARMLKAGLGSSGLEMPEDWDSLNEDEKERRLNNVINLMNDKIQVGRKEIIK